MQKLKDALLLLQKDRKFQVVVLVGAMAVAFLMFGDGSRPGGGAPRLMPAPSSPTLAKEEAAQDVVTVFTRQLQEQGKSIKELNEKLDETSGNLHELEEQTANIFRRVLEKLADIQVQQTQSAVPQVAVSDDQPAFGEDAPGIDGGPQGDVDLEMFGDGTTGATAPPGRPQKQPVALIGAGDSVRVELIAGVNAPTDGTPYPSLFKLVSEVYGPDGSALPLGEARLIAAAQGSLTDQRALFRLTKINIRLPNGRRKVLPVDGWIVGEDGVRGMSGVLIDPIGKVIAGQAFAAGIGAAGEGLAANNTTSYYSGGSVTTFVNGSTAEYAAGKAASGGARAWQEIIRDRYEDMVPVVQVLSGREATAIFSGNFEIEDLYEALEDEDFQFASLD